MRKEEFLKWFEKYLEMRLAGVLPAEATEQEFLNIAIKEIRSDQLNKSIHHILEAMGTKTF
ncbi:hypothetical protein J7L67_05415 [bacterium]|nr:hypothetical protein [bacterium]